MKMDIIESNSPTQLIDDSPVDDCNVFVKYLPCDYTEKELYKLFEPYGSIVNTKVMVNIKTGNSLGYGFVRFSDATFAQEAIKNMNRVQIGYKTLLCKLSKPSTSVNLVNEQGPTAGGDLENPGDPTSTLYVRILSPTITDLMLKQTFSQYGEVIESQVLIDSISGKSKRAGLIRFSNLVNSIKAYNAMNGSLLLGETPLVIKYAPNSTKINKSSSPTLTSSREFQQAQSQQYIQPFSLSSPSNGSQSPQSQSQSQQSFHICTYSHQPQYIYSHQDQYQQYYSSASEYSQSYQLNSYPTHQIFSGDTVLISSHHHQPTTTYYHPEPYYYQISYPIYSNGSNSPSPSSSPTSSPKPNYNDAYFNSYPTSSAVPSPTQQPTSNNSILICTFRGSLEYSNLIQIFSKYGEIKSINININPNNGKTKCFVSYNNLESAINAQQQLDKCKIGQNLIRVKFFNKKL